MAKAIPLDNLPVISRNQPVSSDISFGSGTVILIDKAAGWTSFDVVKKLRGMIKVKKIGHAGTLDPAATGLLILCTGKATKSIEQIQEQEKSYRAEIRFGASTPSYDAETPVDTEADWKHITRMEIEDVIRNKFLGKIDQTVPPYSAVKVNGQRLYKKARKGEEVELKTRPVEIYDLDVISFELPVVTVQVRCSKGTYIRSLAHDIGLALDSRAYLSGLRRTGIGTFSVGEALTVQEFEKQLNDA